jgi:hypothetical protein
MDTFGRRNLLLTTFPNMAWCLLAAGLCFLMSNDNSARIPCIAFFIYLFTAFYGPGKHNLCIWKWIITNYHQGIGPLPSIYFAEAFPLSHRELGAGLTICINNTVGSALSLTFPSLLKGLGPTGAFGFYAGLNMFAFIVIFFIVPETMYATRRPLQLLKMNTANLSVGNAHWRSSTLYLAYQHDAIFPIK